MDKMRALVRLLWQQRFWVLIALAPLVAVPCWSMAASKLQSEFASNKSAIEAQFSAMSKLDTASVHGNERVNAAEKDEARRVRQSVLALWKSLYDQQRERVLYWPKVLDDEFVAYISDKPFGAPIMGQWRDNYWAFIKKRFDGLVEIVQARKIVDPNAAAELGGALGAGPMGGMEMEMEMGRARGMGGDMDMMGRGGYGGMGAAQLMEDDDEGGYILQWLDQAQVQAKLAFARQPTALQIWVTQEDLWVYETLLHVIANTNKARGATRPDNAAIRAIFALQVGRGAAQFSKTPGNIFLPVPSGGGLGGGEEPMGGMPGMGGAYGPEGGMGGMGGMGGTGGMPGMMGERGYGDSMYGAEGGEGMSLDAMLLANRYLGKDGTPLSGDVAELTVGEFRRLPVHMSLLMDERWLPRVLIECANAALPIQIERLQINPAKSAAGFSSGAGGGYGRGMGGDMEMGGGMPPVDTSTSGMPQFAAINFQGVVYIYNPPDPKVLTLPGDEEASEAASGRESPVDGEPTADGASPAAPTAASPAEGPPTDEPPTDEAPTDEPPTEAPTEEPPTEAPPAEGPPVDEATADAPTTGEPVSGELATDGAAGPAAGAVPVDEAANR